MDNNPQVQTPVVNPPISSQIPAPLPASSQPPTAKNNSPHLKILLIILLIVLVVASIIVGYFYMQNNQKTDNSQIYIQPTPVSTQTPTPTVSDQINPNDSSNPDLEKDAQTLNKDLNSISADLESVDKSFSDQQTNLQ